MAVWDSIVDHMGDNSIFILADAHGAKLCGRIRGATAEETGFMLGAAQASLDRQIATFAEHARRRNGEKAVEQFNRGLKDGRTREPYHEGQTVREVKRPEKEL